MKSAKEFYAAFGCTPDLNAIETDPLQSDGAANTSHAEKQFFGNVGQDKGQDCQDCQDSHTGELGNVATYADVAKLVADVSWSWNQWLPNGYAAMIVSEPGAGKSYLALWLARIFAQGGTFPNDQTFGGKRGKILWCETESAQSLTLARAADLELSLDDLLCPLPNPLDPVNLLDTGHRKKVEAIARREDVVLIVVDSLSGGNGNAKENSSDEMKPIVQWLADLAQKIDKPVICTHIFNKLQFAEGTPPLSKIRGSSVISQFFRLIMAIDAPDLLNPKRKRLSVIKSNLAPAPAPLGFEVTAGEILFMEAPDAPRPKAALDTAVAFLADYLKTGRHNQEAVIAAAKERGISVRTLRRAKKSLGVKSEKEYNHFTRTSTWYWQLCQEKPSGELGNVGNVGNVAPEGEAVSGATWDGYLVPVFPPDYVDQDTNTETEQTIW